MPCNCGGTKKTAAEREAQRRELAEKRKLVRAERLEAQQMRVQRLATK